MNCKHSDVEIIIQENLYTSACDVYIRHLENNLITDTGICFNNKVIYWKGTLYCEKRPGMFGILYLHEKHLDKYNFLVMEYPLPNRISPSKTYLLNINIELFELDISDIVCASCNKSLFHKDLFMQLGVYYRICGKSGVLDGLGQFFENVRIGEYI